MKLCKLFELWPVRALFCEAVWFWVLRQARRQAILGKTASGFWMYDRSRWNGLGEKAVLKVTDRFWERLYVGIRIKLCVEFASLKSFSLMRRARVAPHAALQALRWDASSERRQTSPNKPPAVRWISQRLAERSHDRDNNIHKEGKQNTSGTTREPIDTLVPTRPIQKARGPISTMQWHQHTPHQLLIRSPLPYWRNHGVELLPFAISLFEFFGPSMKHFLFGTPPAP